MPKGITQEQVNGCRRRAGQLAELAQRDALQQRADQLAGAFNTHKSVATAERETPKRTASLNDDLRQNLY
jgi:hypothetical protein